MSSSDLAAQNFKPLDDAKQAVKEALAELPASEQATPAGAMSEDRMVESMKKFSYNEFLKRLDGTGSVEDSYEEVEAMLNPSKQIEPRKSVAEEVLDDLLDLITE